MIETLTDAPGGGIGSPVEFGPTKTAEDCLRVAGDGRELVDELGRRERRIAGASHIHTLGHGAKLVKPALDQIARAELRRIGSCDRCVYAIGCL